MKLRLAVGCMAAALWIWLLLLPGMALGAAELEDGVYTANYLVLKAENDSVSMANDYWEKPATVTVKDGKATVRLTINHSKWVTEFKVPGNGGGYVDTKVIVTNRQEDKRVVEFAANVAEPIVSKIHVTVAEIDYDHDYTIRIVFDPGSFQLVKAAAKETAPAATDKPAAVPEPTASAAAGGGAAPGSSAPGGGASGGGSPSAGVSPAASASAKPTAPAAAASPAATQPAAGGAAPADAPAATAAAGQAQDGRSAGEASPEAAERVGEREAAEGAPTGTSGADAGEAGAEAGGAAGGEASGGDAAGSAADGESPQTGGEAGLLAGEAGNAAAVETVAAAGGGTPADEGRSPAGFNGWAPLVAVLLLLAGGAYIVWRRKASES